MLFLLNPKKGGEEMSKKSWREKMMVTMVVVFLGLFIGIKPWCIIDTPAFAASAVTLQGESWTPPMTPVVRVIGPEFMKGLEQATGGMVKTSLLSGGALGPAPELYTRLVQKVIDWGQFNIGYTPGVFPLTEMFELPIRYPSAEILTKAIIEIHKKGYRDKEYGEVKFLFDYAIGPYQLWSNVKITRVEDLAGKKLRCPSPTYVEVTKAVGGVPVSFPSGEIFTAMQKGIIDATWACGDMAAAFKIGEIAKYVIMTNIGTTTQTWAMNKTPFQALPEAGKKYIEENWEKLSLFGGRTFDEYNEKGFAFARKNKVETIQWSEAELKKMDKIITPVFKTWADKLEGKGLPGKKALSDLHQTLEKLGVKEPFVLPR
jgi:TRAP-type C4-dicarboxylate transport system substrate-binding protein